MSASQNIEQQREAKKETSYTRFEQDLSTLGWKKSDN